MQHFKRLLSAVVIILCCGNTISAELQAKLNTQIELLASCMVNDRQYASGATGLNFGTINFGKIAASYNGTVEASLNNGINSSIKIQCNSTLNSIKIIFGAGENDNNVPEQAKTTHFRALRNGDHYIAYNLAYSASKKILKPLDQLSFLNDSQILNIDLYGQVVFADQSIAIGIYRDVIPVIIEF